MRIALYLLPVAVVVGRCCCYINFLQTNSIFQVFIMPAYTPIRLHYYAEVYLPWSVYLQCTKMDYLELSLT